MKQSVRALFAALCLGPACACGQTQPQPLTSDQLKKLLQAIATSAAAANVCNYCIAAKDVTIQRPPGKRTQPLTFTDMRNEPNVPQFRFTNPNGSNSLGPENPGDWFKGRQYIRLVEPEYLLQEIVFKEAPARTFHMWLPGIVPVNKVATDGLWDKLVRTKHLCLGSRFEVPTYYFVGKDAKPMAYVHDKVQVRSDHHRELPGKETQTICEGDLLPVDEVFKEYARAQTSQVTTDLTKRLSALDMDDLVRKATNDWLKANEDRLAAKFKVGPPDSAAATKK